MVDHGYTGKQITRITTQCQMTFKWWQVKNEEVLQYEEEHNITTYWAPTLQEYLDALIIV